MSEQKKSASGQPAPRPVAMVITFEEGNMKKCI